MTTTPTKKKPSKARRDLESTDAFTCPTEPDESLTVNVSSFSRVAQMILRAAMDDRGLYPGRLVSTIRNGQTKIVPGRYEVIHCPLPIQKPNLLARFFVKRLAYKSITEKVYTVDVMRVIDQTTGQEYHIPMCEADQCGAYANGYGENGDVRWCCHAEAVCLLWEASCDEANREGTVLPVAPVASQEAVSPSVCPECNGEGRVVIGHAWLEQSPKYMDCPACQYESTEPRDFVAEPDNYTPYVNRVADFGD